MFAFNFQFINKGLQSTSAQLMRKVLIWYLIFAVIVTTIHIVLEYNSTKNDIKQEIKDVYHAINFSLSTALWNENTEQLNSFIRGVSNLPNINSAAIYDVDKELRGHFGDVVYDFDINQYLNDETHSFQYKKDLYLISNLTVEFRGKIWPAGHLIMTSSTDVIQQRIELGIFLLLFNAILKTIALWTIFILVAKSNLVAPLKQLVSITKTYSSNKNKKLEVSETKSYGNEIYLLQKNFNVMLKEISKYHLELNSINDNLEKEVTNRTLDLETAYKTLEDNHQQFVELQNQYVKSEKMSALGSLVAGVAHELNTPIGNALTVTCTLTSDINELTDLINSGQIKRSQITKCTENNQHSLDIITRNISRAAQLIKSFKGIAVDETQSDRREFILDDYVNDILITFDHILKRKKTTVHCHLDHISLLSYPGPFAQVISNLLNNAITHAFKGTPGTITISSNIEANNVVLKVSDNGKGMNADQLKHIFEPFFTTARGEGGSGLGMYIVFNIVTNNLGGNIEVESQVDSGSTFTITIPREHR